MKRTVRYLMANIAVKDIKRRRNVRQPVCLGDRRDDDEKRPDQNHAAPDEPDPDRLTPQRSPQLDRDVSLVADRVAHWHLHRNKTVTQTANRNKRNGAPGTARQYFPHFKGICARCGGVSRYELGMACTSCTSVPAKFFVPACQRVFCISIGRRRLRRCGSYSLFAGQVG